MKGIWFFYNSSKTTAHSAAKKGMPTEKVFVREHVYSIEKKQKSLFPEKKVFGEMETFLLPTFFYRDLQKNSQVTLQYPGLVYYSRKKNILSLLHTEFSSYKNGILVLPDGKKIEIKERNFFYSLDETSYNLLKKGKGIYLCFQEFTWVLENSLMHCFSPDFYNEKTLPQNAIKSTVQTFEPQGYVSLKSILDPKGGYDRLMQDISQKKFFASGPLQKILNILRSANHDEEIEIMGSLYKNEPLLFQTLTDGIFEKTILPYLSKPEIVLALQSMDDDTILCAIESVNELKLFRAYLSRNRYEYIYQKYMTNKNKGDSTLWNLLLQKLFEKRQSTLYIPGTKLDHWHCFNDKFNIEIEENFLTQYLHANEKIICKWEKSMLSITIDFFALHFDIYVELRRNEFSLFTFRNLKAGTICIPTLPRVPRYVVGGGFRQNGKFFESLAVLVKGGSLPLAS